jgi:1,4-dihydroxy-2-naphthoyl-CoA hydrolase
MTLWHSPIDLVALNALSAATAVAHLGIEFVDAGPDWLTGRMPVDARTVQPFGLLHGGASVLLAETLGSMAANLCVDPARSYCIGQEINANHLRAVRQGWVTGRATPIHRGRTSQVWDIRIADEDERLVCIARLTLAVLDRREVGVSPA